MEWKPEELHFLRPLAFCREAARIPRPQRQLLGRVAAAFVLPLSALFLAHIYISHAPLVSVPPRRWGSYPDRPVSFRHVAECGHYVLFNAVSLVALLCLSHLSTATAVFSVVSAYSGKDGHSSPSVLAALPEAWRRLVAASPAAFLLLVGYVAVVLAAFVLFIVAHPRSRLLLALLLVAYFAGVVLLLCAAVVWSVASAGTVLWDSKAPDASRNGKAVTTGQLWTAAAMVMALNASSLGAVEAFTEVVVRRQQLSLETGGRLVFGMVALVALCAVRLFALVALVASKSCRHEKAEKSNFCDQTADCQGASEPLKAADAHTEQCQA